MTESQLRQHRCCFTGHRPEKLRMAESEVVEALKNEIRTAIADGFQTFISGMARASQQNWQAYNSLGKASNMIRRRKCSPS